MGKSHMVTEVRCLMVATSPSSLLFIDITFIDLAIAY